MLRNLLIFLLSLVIALGSVAFMYKTEVDGMIAMGQEKLDEIINGEKTDDPDNPSDDDDLKVESIALDTEGAKLVFAFGEEFTAEGLKVIATYIDGSTKEIAIEDCNLVKPDTTKPGDRQVTVVYEGKSARYNVTVNLKYIPTISSTSLVDIVGENDSVPYRVEAELIDMVTPGAVKAEGYDSFIAEAPADADITGGDQYLTGYGVAWNYFGFTFTAAENFEDTTLVLRVANPTEKDIDAGIVKMFLNFSQDENGVASGEIPLTGYIIPADGACKWMDIVIRNITIPAGTNTLTFETQKDNAFDIDYVDFYVGMRYVNSVVEIVDSTTIVKDLESLDTEKAFTRSDVANAHNLKDGELFVEEVTNPIEGQVTNGGTSVGAIGKGSQISTTIRVAEDSTVRILFKASAVGKGAYNVADHWNFYIDGVKINIVEVVNIEGGNSAASQWWDWKYTNIGEINLPAGDHFFLLEVHGTDCNVDTVEFEVVSFGSFDECGTDIEDMLQPENPADIVVNAKGEYVFEAENLDTSNLTPSSGQTAVGIETPSGDGPATSGGQSLGKAGGGYASFTFELKDKAIVQIYGTLAHAHGGEAATFMSAKLNDTDLALSGTLPEGTGSMPYWNWVDIPFGGEMELEAGTYTLTVTFLSNPNVDCFKINILSYGDGAAEEGFKVTVEAETFDDEGVVTREDMINAGKVSAGEYMTEEGNGATCICGFVGGTYFKFNVSLEEAKYVEMFLIGATDAAGYDVSTKLSLKVNGNDVTIPSGLLTGSGSTPYWDWQTLSLGKFDLNAGDNEIILTVLDGHPNLDKVFFVEATKDQTHEHIEETIPAVDATCTATGLTEGTKCSECGEILVAQETVDALGHTEETIPAVDATCTATGLTEGTKCSVCGEILVAQTETSKLPHVYDEGDVFDETCNVCGNVRTCEHANVETVEGKAATCTATGLTDGQKCSDCGDVLVAQDTIDVLGHTEETIPAVDATCTATGLTEGTKCSVCGEILVAQETVDALGHNEVVDAAVAPTVSATGLTEGSHCSVCNEVLVAQTEVAKLVGAVIDATGTYTVEGEAFDWTNLTPSSGHDTLTIETPNQTTPETSGGQSLGWCGGGSTTVTLELKDKATVQVIGRLAHAHGGLASSYMIVMIDKGILEPASDASLNAADSNSTYFNWTDIEFGDAVDLEAGTYTITIIFKSNPNVDCFKFEVLTYGEHAEVTEGDLVIDGEGKYTYEAENVDKSSLVLRNDFISAKKYTFTEAWSNASGSGTCLMGYTSGSVVKFYVDVKEAGKLALSMRMSYYSAATFDFSKTTITFAGQTLTPVPAGDFGHTSATDYWMWVDVDLGQVEVEAGIHEFVINYETCDNHNLDYFTFVNVAEDAPACESVCATCGLCTDADCIQLDHLTKCEGHYDAVISENTVYTIEAENWSQENMAVRQDLIDANHSSINGNRLLENSGTTIGGMAEGSYVSFTINVKENSTVAFVMKAAHSTSCVVNQAMTLTVDGVAVELSNNDLLGTESPIWYDWTIFTMGYADISAGEHTIVLTFVEQSPNIDYLALDVMSYGSFSDSEVTVVTEGTTTFQLENVDCAQSLINTRSDFVSSVGSGNCGKGSGRIYGYADGSIFRVVVTVEQSCTLEIKLAGFGGTALNEQQYYFGGQEIVPAEGAVIGSSGVVAEGLVGAVEVSEAGVYVFEFTSGVNTDLDYVSFTVVE